VACDNAFMYPMLEMAQYHVHFIPDVLYAYNHDTPLNDYKLRLNEHLAIARFIQQKKSYKPLEKIPEKKHKLNNVGLLVFSFNRPLQLYAFLESVDRYIKGLGSVTILYRISDEKFEIAYQKIKQEFPHINFVRQNEINPHDTFKKDVLDLIGKMPHDYIIFGVDDIVVKDFVNLSECIDLMEKTHAYGFFLRMGKNITDHYLLDVSRNHDTTIPLYQEIEPGICAWQFRCGKHEWAYPNTVDMTLYQKKDIESVLRTINFTTPNTLEGQWYGASDFSNIGLCFEESKVVNIPLNVVQEMGHNKMFFNKTKYNLAVDDLLKMFNEGLKIDLNPLFKIKNKAPHMDYLPTFTIR